MVHHHVELTHSWVPGQIVGFLRQSAYTFSLGGLFAASSIYGFVIESRSQYASAVSFSHWILAFGGAAAAALTIFVNPGFSSFGFPGREIMVVMVGTSSPLAPSLFHLQQNCAQRVHQCRPRAIIAARCRFWSCYTPPYHQQQHLLLHPTRPNPHWVSSHKGLEAVTGGGLKPRRRRRGRSGYVFGAEKLGLEAPLEEGSSSQESIRRKSTAEVQARLDSDLNDSNLLTGGSSSSLEYPLGIDGREDYSDLNGSICSEEEEDSSHEKVNSCSSEGESQNWRMFSAEEGAGSATASDANSSCTLLSDTEKAEQETAPEQLQVRRRLAEDLLSEPDKASGRWSPAELQKIDFLERYEYRHESKKGVLVIQALRKEHMKATEELLVDSFAELMGGLLTYRPLLSLTVKQYVRERRAALPQAVTLVGLYAPAEDNPSMGLMDDRWSGNWIVAGTVELSFCVTGHPYLPNPPPPPNAPYICNMAVSRDYRRRGLGRQMLKAAEDLAMTKGYQDMYLHCRIVDTAPLNMYKEAGYQVVATDSLLSVLTFQRRRYLMRKRLSKVKLVPE